MQTPVENIQGNKSKVSANVKVQGFADEPYLTFLDNRPETITQRKLQTMVNNSAQVEKAGQLKGLISNQISNVVPLGNNVFSSALPISSEINHAYAQEAIIQRLIDIDVPLGVKVYVCDEESDYYEWQGRVIGRKDNKLKVRISDPDNWRAKSIEVEMAVNQLVQIPEEIDFHELSLEDATRSQLSGIEKRGIAGHNMGIVEGRFTGRKDEEGNIDTTTSPEGIRLLRDETLRFMGDARALGEGVKEDQRRAGMFLQLYRGMHSATVYNLRPGAVITEPLPFSTTFNKSFARTWSETDAPNESIIMKIQLPVNFPMIFLSSPKWLGNFDVLGNQIVNQQQQEVTVAPMQLRILDSHMEGTVKVFDVLAEKPLSDEEVWEIFGDAAQLSRERREEAEAERERRIQEEEQQEKLYQAYALEVGDI